MAEMEHMTDYEQTTRNTPMALLMKKLKNLLPLQILNIVFAELENI